MSNTPLAEKTYRWSVDDVIVVLKACGADESRLRDESYLLEELRRIDAEVMDQWLAMLASFRERPRVKLFAEALSYLSSPNYDEERDALARGSHMALADYVFTQAWARSSYLKAAALARTHDLIVNPAPR
jgi:hypothetical protein